MTVLGEAFIEIRADLRPFTKNLNNELERAASDFEKRLKGAVDSGLKDVGGKAGDKLGEDLGDGVERGLKKKALLQKNSPIWVKISAALASALDDGISALPAEVKAAIVLGIIAALPIISGALAGAVTAAVGVAFTGIGSLIAFQYDEVRERGTSFANSLRLLLVDTASEFVPAMLNALDIIENRFEAWAPLLSRIFSRSSKYLEPLTNGLLDFIESILSLIESSMDETDGFVAELVAGLKTLGIAVGAFFKILADTGESGREAFRDFIFLTANLIINLARMIAFFTEVYHWIRIIGEALGPVTFIMGAFSEASDRAAGANMILVTRNKELARSTEGVIKLTDEETKRLKELERNLKDASDATYGIIQSQIDFQRSLAGIREALKENGKTLDITKEKGQENVEAFLKGLKDAEKETQNQVAIGRLSSQQAAQYYNEQIEMVRKLALQAGITNEKFNLMFGDIIRVAQLKLDAEAMGLTNTTEELQNGVNAAADLYMQLLRIRSFRLPDKGTRPFSEYAEGGIVRQPTQALIGEAGPEVVIPLTRPSRAAQLMQQSGLAGMLTAAATLVQVFIGNEQLEGRMVQVAERNNAALGNSLAFGARGL